MDIRWCVLDLDGTLLDSKGSLSEENVQAVNNLAATGVGIILATGRSDLFVRDYVSRLGVTLPVISCNGGLVRDVHSGEVLFSRIIPEGKARAFSNYLIDQGFDTLAYSYDRVYFSSGSKKIGKYHSYNAEVEAAFQVPLREVHNVEELPLKTALKFLVSNIDSTVAKQIETDQNADGMLSMVQSMRDVLDIMANNVSKGQALEILAEKLGMDLARTAVFGDNQNDIDMLRIVGLPIAPANAEENVKLIARHIAPSNDENGVAWAIRELILGKKG